MKTESFSCADGDEIHLFVSIDTGGASVKAGLIEPNGDKRFIGGTDWMEHGFVISTPGSYRIFVENNSGQTLTVDGTYVMVENRK